MTFTSALTRQQILDNTILLVRHGSHAYGMATETSDVDLKGICVPPLGSYLGLNPPFEVLVESQHDGHPNDLAIHSIQKFVRLACNANPTILEILFIDEPENILKCNEQAACLRCYRDLFLSKKVYESFCGYAKHQLHLVEKNGVSNADTRAKSWKNLSHTIRLLRTCNELLATEQLIVKRDDAPYLLEIKQGKIPLYDVVSQAQVLLDLCRRSHERSPLPKEPNYDRINSVLLIVTYECHGA